MEQFCSEHGVPFERCGKVVVAVSARELPRLDELERRGAANGVRAERIGPERLREIEPHANGVAALHVPDTGIVDFGRVAEALVVEVSNDGVEVRLGEEVTGIDERAGTVTVETDRGSLTARVLVNCAGLHSDVVAEADGVPDDVRIVPFRGEYHSLLPPRRVTRAAPRVPRARSRPPVPRRARVAWHRRPRARRSQRGARARSRGLSVGRRRRAGAGAARALPRLLAHGRPLVAGRRRRSPSVVQPEGARRAVSKLVPGIEAEDLVPHRAGVRAQAVARDGRLLDDFVIRQTSRGVHVLNAPSPAATASLKIGETIATSVVARL